MKSLTAFFVVVFLLIPLLYPFISMNDHQGRGSYFPHILLNEIQTMFSQLAKQSARVLPADLCTDHAHYVKNHRSTVLRRNKNIKGQGRTVSHYYILVIRKFFDFMSLFRLSVWFSFSVKQFPSAEFGIWFATYSCVYLIGTAEELSYRAVFCCKPYRKVKVSSRNRAFSSSCDLFITIALNFNVEFKELTNRNKRSETLWRVMFVQVCMICTAVSSYL